MTRFNGFVNTRRMKKIQWNVLVLVMLIISEITIATATSSSSSTQQCDSTTNTKTRLAQIQISESPRIYVYDRAFTKDQINELIARGKQELVKNTATHHDNMDMLNGEIVKLKPNNTDNNHDIVNVFRKTMAMLALAPEENAEPLQISLYRHSQKMEVHFDSNMEKGRFVTVLVFLVAPQQGGELIFPWAKRHRLFSPNDAVTDGGISGTGRRSEELQGVKKEPLTPMLCNLTQSNVLAIKPVVGRVVVWFNHNLQLKRLGYEALHGSCPVQQGGGEKMIAQLYVRWRKPGEHNALRDVLVKVGLDWELTPVQGV